MQHVHSLDGLNLERSWLTIGVFDGVHRGHQAIIKRLVAGARADGCQAVVLTFSPHPAVVLGHRDLKCLTTPDERAALLGAMGVDLVVTHPFDEAVAGTSAAEFMRRLSAHLGVKHLLAGYDFALGRGREGNPARLAEIGRDLDYEVEIVEAVGDESGVISSTAIRKLIAVGNVAEGARLLGRPYALSGTVVHGDARGRAIGVPTANLDVSTEKVLPANGIYATHALLDGRTLDAATNVGVRPTFAGGDPAPRVEAYLLDFDADIYGCALALEFVARLRDEEKFPTVEALVAQMKTDIENVRTLLKQTPR